jgi:hypothetical protein
LDDGAVKANAGQRRGRRNCSLSGPLAAPNSPVTMSLFDQGISGAMMTSIAVSPSMFKMTATASVESD